jgi:hypothetical protein
MELSLYYSRVEPPIGHSPPRTKSRAALDHLKRHSTRYRYTLNSISTHLRDIVLKWAKVQGGVQGSLSFPPSTQVTLDRIAQGPVYRLSTDLSDKGATRPIAGSTGYPHLVNKAFNRRWQTSERETHRPESFAITRHLPRSAALGHNVLNEIINSWEELSADLSKFLVRIIYGLGVLAQLYHRM